MAKAKPKYAHALQLRLLPSTVAAVDEAILNYNILSGFTRSTFIRKAIGYALYNLENDPDAKEELAE